MEMLLVPLVVKGFFAFVRLTWWAGGSVRLRMRWRLAVGWRSLILCDSDGFAGAVMVLGSLFYHFVELALALFRFCNGVSSRLDVGLFSLAAVRSHFGSSHFGSRLFWLGPLASWVVLTPSRIRFTPIVGFRLGVGHTSQQVKHNFVARVWGIPCASIGSQSFKHFVVNVAKLQL